ncbi:uncharacterized protein BO80DRAFT_435678 [Aspergillus ibericus CBS 121593]|uniref:Uncharacterized protein n=1 Tax=Aspergillus ibericus CBS 121593 TaxID=1448316 RepID=A0A395GWP5_9EURO|nr:hypothetical protein BO80DRAFT_435678 [Aspergillus ibericus CBS 121593]RAL00001.1 hypothetical protein BO80DRAFT_435678 [Aspergillus ibericus CBS 121593]
MTSPGTPLLRPPTQSHPATDLCRTSSQHSQASDLIIPYDLRLGYFELTPYDTYCGMTRVLALSIVGILAAVGMTQTVCLEECFDMEQPCPYGQRSINVEGCWSCCRPIDEDSTNE